MNTNDGISVDFLRGVRVLVVAHYIPGPFAAYLLRHLGAEVIKVEPPFGDLMHQLPPFYQKDGDKHESAFYRAINGGMKSIAVNFKSSDGVEVLRRLIAASNVIIDGNRAGYLERILGSSLHCINPEALHIPITAFGLNGPLKNVAGHDNNILAMAGNLSYGGDAGDSSTGVWGQQLADITAGYVAALQALGWLFGRNNSASATKVNTIDVSMLHAAFSLNQIYLTGMSATGKSPQADQELLNGAMPNYRMYFTKDSRKVFFGPIEHNLFANFATRVERDDLMPLLGKDNSKLREELNSIFASKTLVEWEQTLENVDCCFTPVRTLAQAAEDPQIRALSLVRKCEDNLLVSGYPAGFGNDSLQPKTIGCEAPTLGEHSEEVLKTVLGYEEGEIKRLIQSKAVLG
jgi:alpha-methylacyl-CoA racemase